MADKNTAGRKKLIVILLITAVFCLLMSYVPNKLYTFSCFSHNDKRAIMTGFLLIVLAYSFAAAKLCGITPEDMGIFRKLYRVYLFLLLPGMLIQLLRICMGKCTFITGISEFFLYLLVAVSEEILFRGLMTVLSLKITLSTKAAVIIQAVIFGLMHYFNASYGSLPSCFPPMVLGAIFGSLIISLPADMGLPTVILLHWLLDMCAG